MTSLVRLDPFRDLFDLERDMSRFLSRSFGDLTDGVLEVVVPHAAELTGAKRIPIEVGKRKALISKAKKAA